MEVFFPFWMSEVFCQHSVAVLCESFHLYKYNCSTCIFHVSVEEGELCFLLLRHLGLFFTTEAFDDVGDDYNVQGK